jgi:hypothetical protein
MNGAACFSDIWVPHYMMSLTQKLTVCIRRGLNATATWQKPNGEEYLKSKECFLNETCGLRRKWATINHAVVTGCGLDNQVQQIRVKWSDCKADTHLPHAAIKYIWSFNSTPSYIIMVWSWRHIMELWNTKAEVLTGMWQEGLGSDRNVYITMKSTMR